MAKQEAAIRSNHCLRDCLRSEYAIAYPLEKRRVLVAAHGNLPRQARNDHSFFPALGFAAQVVGVLNRCMKKQARRFVRRVRTAFSSAENMQGLRLELQAATHFTRRGKHVSWHRSNNAGTFDFLVDDLGPSGLEVEYKSISDDKGRRIHRHDRDPDKRSTGLRLGFSDFLTSAPDHIVGGVFGSRSGLHPTGDGSADMGGVTNYFVKEESLYWHDSFRELLRASSGIA